MKKIIFMIIAVFFIAQYTGCCGDTCALWEDDRTSDITKDVTGGTTAKFAVIGDYGADSQAEFQVAEMIKAWAPDFIITTGDNNYPGGSALTIDDNIGQFYHQYIGAYNGVYGDPPASNMFFPTLGNHDWYPQAYIEYFTLPGNERYYDFTWGPIHFFALSTYDCEPDGIDQYSKQALWLKNKLASSTKPYKFVYGHHPAYSSGKHGSTQYMQWPFEAWGADTYMAGHDHTYERIMDNGFPYFISGLGGKGTYNFAATPLPNSVSRYNAMAGAMLVSVTDTEAVFSFYAVDGSHIDTYTLTP